MGAINLYKIDKNKIGGFNVSLSERMKLVAAETITKTFEEQQREFICSLYLSASSGEKQYHGIGCSELLNKVQSTLNLSLGRYWLLLVARINMQSHMDMPSFW